MGNELNASAKKRADKITEYVCVRVKRKRQNILDLQEKLSGLKLEGEINSLEEAKQITLEINRGEDLILQALEKSDLIKMDFTPEAFLKAGIFDKISSEILEMAASSR